MPFSLQGWHPQGVSLNYQPQMQKVGNKWVDPTAIAGPAPGMPNVGNPMAAIAPPVAPPSPLLPPELSPERLAQMHPDTVLPPTVTPPILRPAPEAPVGAGGILPKGILDLLNPANKGFVGTPASMVNGQQVTPASVVPPGLDLGGRPLIRPGTSLVPKNLQTANLGKNPKDKVTFGEAIGSLQAKALGKLGVDFGNNTHVPNRRRNKNR